MKKLTTSLCLIFAVLFGSVGVSWSADFEKGLAAYDSGDFVTARREWTPLAKQGNADTQNKLGVMYEFGMGVSQDDKTAIKWYRLAAEQGVADAQTNLGGMYAYGRGVPQDGKTAIKWHTLAAKQGYALAPSNLGGMYEYGEGVPQDDVIAYMWYNIAASFGGIMSKIASETRNRIAKRMTSAQLTKAQDLTRECVRRQYNGC